MARETLPKDGARYQCGFGFNLYEDWRCDNDATEAFIDLDSKDLPKHVVIHARALCPKHFKFLGL
jgi:hypothetical protein